MHSLIMAGPDLRLRGELPQYASLRFKRCFWEVGSFQLTVKRGTPGWDSLSRETILYLPERPETALLAEKITVDEEKVTVSGVPLKGLCKRRICVPQSVQGDQYDGFGWDRFTGDGESAYLHYAAANLTSPEDEKRKIPGLVLRTSLITGLPYEDDAAFEELCDFLREVKIERAGVFTFSPEEGTKAALMDHVDTEEARRRAELVVDVQSDIIDAYNDSILGEEREVLCEGYDSQAQMFYGRSYAESPDIDGRIWFTADSEITPGSFVNVRLTGIMDGETTGEMVEA